MTLEQFGYWLHGFCELNGNAVPTPAQWKSISAHLDTVFKKVTPPDWWTPGHILPDTIIC